MHISCQRWGLGTVIVTHPPGDPLVSQEEEEIESPLVALAAGELPLGLIVPLLERVQQRAQREQEAAEARVAERLLAARDYRLLEFFRVVKAPPRFLKLIEEHWAAERLTRRPAESVVRRLDLSEAARALLRHCPRRPRWTTRITKRCNPGSAELITSIPMSDPGSLSPARALFGRMRHAIRNSLTVPNRGVGDLRRLS
jgi:hypothetical protein